MCAGLAYAHDRHLIHSDFKPGNIFVTSSETTKILDFGIARAASSEVKISRFDAGQLGALTPTYASLEMIHGEEPHYSDDVFALACVFYEMLSGKHPYDRVPADKALAKKKKPKKLRQLSSRQWQALESALELRREDRTKSVKEFASKFHRNRKSLWIMGSGVVLLSLVAGLSWQYYQEIQKEKKLELAIRTAYEDAQSCLSTQQYECAKEKSSVVLNLSPQNIDAQGIYQQAVNALNEIAFQKRVEDLMQEADACFAANDFQCATVKAQDVLALDEHRTSAKNLIDKMTEITKQQSVENYLVKAQTCIDENDFACGREYLVLVQDLDSTHPKILELTNYMDETVKKRQAKAQAKQTSIDRYLAKARQCRVREDYNCVIDQTKKVLSLSPNHPGASRLKQQAEIAKDTAQKPGNASFD